jgi:hypothetical protein
LGAQLLQETTLASTHPDGRSFRYRAS